MAIDLLKYMIWKNGIGGGGGGGEYEETVEELPIIRVANAVTKPALSLISYMEPSQDLHGYDYPWPDGGGPNALPVSEEQSVTANGVTFTSNGDGSYTITGKSTGTVNLKLLLSKSFVFPSSDNYRIAFGNDVASSYVTFKFFDGDTQFNSYQMSTANKVADTYSTSGRNCDGVGITIYTSNVTFNMTLTPMVIEKSVDYSTYAPSSNICPIEGHTGVTVTRTGKNVFSVTPSQGRDIDANGTVTYANNRTATVNGVPVVGNAEYTLSYGRSSLYTTIFFYDKNDTFISSLPSAYGVRTFTTPADAAFVRFSWDYNMSITNAQLEVGSEATEYESYVCEQYPVTWQDSVGTVYGGTVDVASGTLTATHGVVVFDGTQNNLAFSAGTTANRIGWNGYISIGKAGTPFLSDTLKTSSNASSVKGDPWLIYNTSTDPRMFMTFPTTITSAADFNTYCAEHPITVVYELAEPQVIQMTPTQVQMLDGENTVWNSEGYTTLKYYAKKV